MVRMNTSTVWAKKARTPNSLMSARRGSNYVKNKTLNRTVAYYQLVDSPKNISAPELDWNAVLRSMGTKQHTFKIFEKEVYGTVSVLDVEPEWEDFLEPSQMQELKTTWHDETIYLLSLSTDKDHVPNQRKDNGQLIPMRHDKDGRPATAVFIWFLPFGNIFGIIREDNTAIQPRYIASWLNRYLRENDLLPQPNFQFGSVPVIDKDTERKLKSGSKLSKAELRGKVRGTDPEFFRDLLGGGPKLKGSFNIKISITPVKAGGGGRWESDSEELYDWFNEVFGTAAGLDAATVRFAKTPDQDDLPTDPINLFEHRITRKRQVQIARSSGSVPSLSARSAGAEIVRSYIQDFEELQKHRS